MTIPLLGATDPAFGRMRVSAHYDLWHGDVENPKRTLVATTRPCAECGLPLSGVVVPVNDTEQAHAACRER